jgi:hypothetical protein
VKARQISIAGVIWRVPVVVLAGAAVAYLAYRLLSRLGY